MSPTPEEHEAWAIAAFEDVVDDVIELAKRSGTPIVIGENGVTKYIDPHHYREYMAARQQAARQQADAQRAAAPQPQSVSLAPGAHES